MVLLRHLIQICQHTHSLLAAADRRPAGLGVAAATVFYRNRIDIIAAGAQLAQNALLGLGKIYPNIDPP